MNNLKINNKLYLLINLFISLSFILNEKIKIISKILNNMTNNILI